MKNKILTIACVLFGLMMINSGLNKFFNYLPMPELSEEMMKVMLAFLTIKWILPLVAIVEITGGLLLAIPKTRSLGALLIFPVMLGIVVHHMVLDPSGIGLALVLFGINLWAIAANWNRYQAIIR